MPPKIACQWEPTGTQDDQGRPYHICTRCGRVWRFHSLGVAVACLDQTTGLGDIVASVIKTATLGLVQPCGGCDERRKWLNRFRV